MAAYQVPGLPEQMFARRGGEAMRARLLRTGLNPASAGRYAARATDLAAMRGALNWYRGLPFSLRERTPAISVPTLFVWSDGDRFVSRAAAESCGRFVTGPYQFEVFPGASHWLPEETPDKVADHLVRQFTRAADA